VQDECRQLAQTVSDLIDRRMLRTDFRHGETDGDLAAELADGVGITLAMVPESAGGFGLDPADVLRVLRPIGRFTGSVPTVERVHATWLAAVSGLPGGDAVASDGADLTLTRNDKGCRVYGTIPRFAWPQGSILVPVASSGASWLIRLNFAATGAQSGQSLAGEPRASMHIDTVLDDAAVVPFAGELDLTGHMALGAALRCQLIAGAATRVFDMTLAYMQERKQFGRPLGAFQTVQHQMALMAGEMVSAQAAADAAADAFGIAPDVMAIAAAKVRCGEAAGRIAAAAHQLHGAIGYSAEYALHRLTKQLLSWRDEWGNESYWARILGASVLAQAQSGLWPLLAPIGAGR
jgi:acyl-CoA dehydrogenase